MKPKNDLRPQAALKWLEKAKHDLDTAVLNHRHGGHADVTCYFSHQVTEKSLKAFLIQHSIRFKKIHHLPGLLKMCLKQNQQFSEFKKACRILNDYYIETRYPMDIPINYTKKEAEEALHLAEQIYQFVKTKLS